MPMGLDQVWEPLEGLSPGDKLVTLMTPSRTDLALLQSRPNHLQGQRGRSEDCAGARKSEHPGPVPGPGPPECSGGDREGSRARPGPVGARLAVSDAVPRAAAGGRAGLDHRTGRALP